jgi:PAS domain S-box-containing protein
VSVRVAAEQRLAEAQERHRSLVELLPLVTYIDRLAPKNPPLWVSPQIQALVGYTPEQWVADPDLFGRVVHPEDRDRILASTIPGESVQSYAEEYRMIARDGRVVWVRDEATLVRDADGRPLYLQGFWQDITERRLAAEALQAAEAKYRSLVEQLPLVTYIDRADRIGASLYMSPQIEPLLGYPVQQWLDDDELFSRLVHPDDQERVRAAAGRSIETLEGYDSEYRLIAADGRTVWVHDVGRIVTDQAGAPLFLQGYLVDITEKVEARERLEETERRYRELIERLPLTTYIDSLEPGSTVVYVSPQIEQLLGYQADAWMSDPSLFGRTLHPDDREHALAEYAASQKELARRARIADGSPDETLRREAEYRLIARDGRTVWIHDESTVVRGAHGAVPLAQGFMLDITAQKLAEERIREAELRFRRLVHELPLVVFTAALDGQITYVSPQIEEIIGHPVEATREDPGLFRSLIHPDDLPRFLARVGRAQAELAPLRIEYRIFDSSGRLHWVRDVSIFIRDDRGRATHVQGYLIDITAQRQAEEALAQAQKLESLGVLAGGIAHDFNNLLVAVLGHAGLALIDLPEGSAARADVEQIERAAKRAAELAGALLAYSGRGKFVIGRLDASELVRETARLLEVSTGSRAQIRYELANDLPPIEGDATQLRQVVMNLVINASDAIEGRQGVIAITTATVEVGPDEAAELRAGDTFEPGRYVLIEVADTGAGMDEVTRARIFEPFFTTKFTGRGLGLAAVQGIVRGHRGAIGVRSEPGQGSRFRVFLPQAASEGGTPDRVPGPAAEQLGSETILVIDDDDTVRTATARMLQVKGFRTVVAADGPEGIETFREQMDTIDAVLVDLTMPRMSGLEVMRAIREIRADARIVLMSGYSEPAVGEARESDRPAGFIQKPFTPAHLSSAIRAAIESS